LHVVAVLGHFPGEGAASQDPESGPATVGLSLAELRTRDLVPFAAALHSASAIQTSDALFSAIDPVTPAAISPAAVALLRQRLQYGGVIVSGDLTAAASYAGTSVGAAAVAALRAGSDMLYVPGDPADQEQAYTAVLLAVRGGQLPLRTIAVAVARVLALKRGYGVLGR
jgi:beta-N-acetylhexosaminidase